MGVLWFYANILISQDIVVFHELERHPQRLRVLPKLIVQAFESIWHPIQSVRMKGWWWTSWFGRCFSLGWPFEVRLTYDFRAKYWYIIEAQLRNIKHPVTSHTICVILTMSIISKLFKHLTSRLPHFQETWSIMKVYTWATAMGTWTLPFTSAMGSPIPLSSTAICRCAPLRWKSCIRTMKHHLVTGSKNISNIRIWKHVNSVFFLMWIYDHLLYSITSPMNNMEDVPFSLGGSQSDLRHLDRAGEKCGRGARSRSASGLRNVLWAFSAKKSQTTRPGLFCTNCKLLSFAYLNFEAMMFVLQMQRLVGLCDDLASPEGLEGLPKNQSLGATGELQGAGQAVADGAVSSQSGRTYFSYFEDVQLDPFC